LVYFFVSLKSKLVVGVIIGIGILIGLFFIPANEFIGVNSHSSESPPPILVLSNYPEDFEITPISCMRVSDNVEFQFNIENKLDEDYMLEMHLILNDKNEENLLREGILVKIHAKETTLENHQTLFNPDMKICGIELKRAEKVV